MALDELVVNAINTAVKNHNQSSKVSKRLVTWLNQVAEGNSSLDSPDDYGRHLDEVLEAIYINKADE